MGELQANARIHVAGHRGLVGSAIVRRLRAAGHETLLLRAHDELDLTRQADVADFYEAERPEFVFLAAAKVGGIVANDTRRGDFIRENLLIQTNVIEAARRIGVRKLVFLGSTCIYPRLAEQPMREEALLTGPLEPTNEAYAVAKIAGITMCRAYARQYGFRALSLMPTNLYGPGDNFDLETSHVIPALMRKAHEAKLRGSRSLTVWGTGAPTREFLHVDDLADAAVFCMDEIDPAAADLLNVGTGEEISIRDLARLICEVVGFAGEPDFDASKPDGTPRKVSDVSRLASLGWRARTGLRDGLAGLYAWYLEHGAAKAA